MSCRFQTQFMQIPFWSQFVIWRKIRNKNFKMTWDDVSHMSLAHWMAAVNGGIGLKLAQLLSRNSPSPSISGKAGRGFLASRCLQLPTWFRNFSIHRIHRYKVYIPTYTTAIQLWDFGVPKATGSSWLDTRQLAKTSTDRTGLVLGPSTGFSTVFDSQLSTCLCWL